MKYMSLMGVCLIVAAVALMGGCGGDNGPEPAGVQSPEAAEEEATVLETMDEYREEAASEITSDNAEAELEKLQKEIESDVEVED